MSTSGYRLSPRARRNIEGYLFISPWVIGFVAFILGPFIFSLFLSFSEWGIGAPPKFVGLANFEKMLNDELFWKSLGVTLTFVLVSVVFRVSIALGIASLLSKNVVGHRFFQAGFYLPVMFSGVILGVVWAWMFPSDYGLINDLLRRVGIPGPRWLSDPTLALISIIMMSMWRIGGMMVIFLAGLKDIPEELYEAADIDGANAWRKFYAITIPMLTPIVLFNLVMSMIQSFQVFGEVQVLTAGGPYNSTLVYMLYLYRQAFTYLHMGYGSALAWVLFVLIISATLLLLRSSRSWVYYGGVRT
jgi:multiple sugar transport system permease protein